MKALVKVKTPLNLIDTATGDFVGEDRPYLVTWSQFIQMQVGANQLTVVANDIPKSATDAEFAEFWKASDGKEDLAVESFMSQFRKPKPEPEPKKTRKQTQAAE